MNQLTGLIGVTLPAAPATAATGVPAGTEEVAGDAASALFAGLVAQQSLPAGEPTMTPGSVPTSDNSSPPPPGVTVTELQMAAQLQAVDLAGQKVLPGKPLPAGDPTQSQPAATALPTLAARLAAAVPVAQGQTPDPLRTTVPMEGETPAASSLIPAAIASGLAAPAPPAGSTPVAETTPGDQATATYAPGRPSPASPSPDGQESTQTGGENPGRTATPVPALDIPEVETASPSAAGTAPAPDTVADSNLAIEADRDSVVVLSAANARPANIGGVQTANRPAGPIDAPASQAVRSQVLSGVEPALAKGGMQDLTIQLDPEDLGRVEVRFQASGNRLAVTIVAGGADAEQILREGAKELGEAIALRSARFQNVEVRVEARENDERDQQRQENRREESAKGSNRDQGDGRRRSTREPRTTAEAWADLAQGG